MKTRYFSMIVMLFCGALWVETWAEENRSEKHFAITQCYLDIRGDYDATFLGNSFAEDMSSLRLRCMMFRLDGQFTKGLNYSYRHRLHAIPQRNFIKSIDWLYLNWDATEWLSLTAGKLPVAIGGVEYDMYPADIYMASEYANEINGFQWGAHLAFHPTKADNIILQLAQSPLHEIAGENKWSIHTEWLAAHGIWHPLWSVSALQSVGSDWMGILALGNRFDFCRWCRMDLDLTARTGMKKEQWTGKDWTIVSELSFTPIDALRIFGRYTCDFNLSGNNADILVYNGTQLMTASGGIEYMPLKISRESIRLFAAAGYSWGEQTNPNGSLSDNCMSLQIGLKWKIDIKKSVDNAINRHAQKILKDSQLKIEN